MQLKQWSVEIHIDEIDEETHARAVLVVPERTAVQGSGNARLNPADRPVPAIGDELAAGRALVDLGHRILQLAAADVAEATAGGPATPRQARAWEA